MKYIILIWLFFISLLAPDTAKGTAFCIFLPKSGIAEKQFVNIFRDSSKNEDAGNYISAHKHKKSLLSGKIFRKFFKRKFAKLLASENKQSSKGILPLILSITGIGFVFIPSLMPLAFIFLLVAVIYGKNITKNYPGDKKASTAVSLGWIGLVLLAGALLLSLFGAFQYIKFD